MYSRILVPLDGSSIAERALPYARLLCRALNVSIELISVNDTELSPRAVAHRIRSFNAPQHRVTTGELEAVAAALAGSGCKTKCSILHGNAAHRIVEAAGGTPETLIVISSRGRSGIQKWMVGSVTDKVVRTSPSPVLVVRGNSGVEPEDLMIERVVLPLDGSPLAEQAIPHAVAVATALKARITTVFVTPAHGDEEGRSAKGRSARVAAKMFAGLENMAGDYLSFINGELERQGVRDRDQMILSGDPADKILELSQATPNSIVVMSTHGRSGLQAFFLGSVTDRVVRYSAAPVLVVRPVEQAS